jgi:hypothetical protein
MQYLQRMYFLASPVPICLAIVGEAATRGWHGPGLPGGLAFVTYAFYTSLALLVIGVALIGVSKLKHQRVLRLVISTFVGGSLFIYLVAGMLCGAA